MEILAFVVLMAALVLVSDRLNTWNPTDAEREDVMKVLRGEKEYNG